MKEKLFLDMDSTIVKSIEAYCIMYNAIYRNEIDFTEADPTKVNQWNLSDQCNLETNPKSIFGMRSFFQMLDFMPNAQEVITKLSERYDVTICSIGTYENLQHKAEWINNHLPFVSAILLKTQDIKMDKSVVDMKESIFIDDHMDNLVSSNASTKICYGKKYPWNKKWKGIWLNDWELIEQFLL